MEEFDHLDRFLDSLHVQLLEDLHQPGDVGLRVDEDQRVGGVWDEHKQVLDDHFGNRLLLKGSPSEFKSGISKYNLQKAAA